MIGYLKAFTCIFIFSAILLNVECEECIYGSDGLCMEPCPPKTVSYSPGCDEEVISQRTCRSPIPRRIGRYCDYSRCDCENDQVWDEAARKCVILKDCSDQSKLKSASDRV
ncbi:uncharacterized protein LOC126369554 [Pectinophora gossypiella]|uniref:uncharacterized protein LOC126369554 n=1 Tax=Pectinophora gossypiella TaxID=13191 RepID=UPI00214E50CA|nr:uncharacterized protein LOC126369554 [Pectinophora gossypiella]